MPRSEKLLATGVTIAAAAAAIATGRWTVLLVPVIWGFAWLCTRIALPQRFVLLIAVTVMLPRYPLRFGLSLDDVAPSLAAIPGLIVLARWGFPRLPRMIEAAFGAWLIGGIASAVVNGNGLADMVKLAGPSVGRPVFWLIFTMTAAAIASRHGLRPIVGAVAVVAILESIFAVAAYARCTEIHVNVVSHPDNEPVWESRRPLGVEQGAGTNVGEQRIRCRATGTLAQSSNFLAAFLVTALPAAAGMAFVTRGARRVMFTVGSFVVLAALVLTFTRASLIAAAAAMLVMLLVTAPRRAGPVLLAAAVVIVVVAVAVPQVRTRFSEGESDRVALWYSGLLIFADHPAFGVGYGNYLEVQRANPKYLQTKFGEPTSTAHNGFIGIAAEGGALQAGAVLLLAGAMLAYGARAARDAARSQSASSSSDQRALVGATLGCVVAFSVQNLTNTLLLVPAVATYFWVFGGALIGVRLAASAESPGHLAPKRGDIPAE